MLNRVQIPHLGRVVAVVFVTAALATACEDIHTTAPSDQFAPTATAASGDPVLKVSTVVGSTPKGNETTATLSPQFLISGGDPETAGATVQYRFRVVDPSGSVAIDSGLQNGKTWAPSAPLTPRTAYTWIARAEYLGGVGAWSAPAAFTTPVAPGPDYGTWEETCSKWLPSAPDVANCVWVFVKPANSMEDFEVVKRAAWILRGQGAGLLLKSSGENVVPWLGTTYSASRVCYPDGHIYKLISDAGPGGANSPTWQDNDFVDPSLYQPAIDPRLR